MMDDSKAMQDHYFRTTKEVSLLDLIEATYHRIQPSLGVLDMYKQKYNQAVKEVEELKEVLDYLEERVRTITVTFDKSWDQGRQELLNDIKD